MKTCRLCQTPKPLDQFSLNARSPDGRHPWCKECKNDRQRGHYDRNREAILAKQKLRIRQADGSNRRRDWVRNGVEISVEEYRALLEQQGGVCAICAQPDPKRELSVDHCHETGRVRGLLCQSCNWGIGLLKDDPTLIEAALNYLVSRRSPAALIG